MFTERVRFARVLRLRTVGRVKDATIGRCLYRGIGYLHPTIRYR
jgi:hypothetical protein